MSIAGLDSFVGSYGDGMGMDMDDPVLHSLQTMAEGQEFGDMEHPQNFDVWEWFEMQ
jgi:hypothetical protein